MKTIRLEHRIGHFKFYELWAGAYVDNASGVADKAFAGCRFGKIGTEGQTTLKDFEGPGCAAEAQKYVQRKIQEKLNHGYEMVGTDGTAEVAETADEVPAEQLL